MTRIKASTLLLALVGFVLFLSGPVITAPPAYAACAANQQLDPRTGMCWSTTDRNIIGTPRSTGGTAPCIPGRLGTCLAAAQNGTQPGANLKPHPPAGPAPRTTWPAR